MSDFFAILQSSDLEMSQPNRRQSESEGEIMRNKKSSNHLSQKKNNLLEKNKVRARELKKQGFPTKNFIGQDSLTIY